MTTDNMIRCKKCGYYFSADTKVCPECGAIIISGRLAMVKYIVLVLLALLILFLIGYDKKVEPVEPTEPVAPAEPLEPVEPKEKSSQSAIYSQSYDFIAGNIKHGIIPYSKPQTPDMIFNQTFLQAAGASVQNHTVQSQVVAQNRMVLHKCR